MKIRIAAIAPTAVALTLLVAGCSPVGMGGMDHDDMPPSASSDASFNAADEMFVIGMIPHHEQALTMSESLLAKDGVDERVVALAERILAAQQPEIDLMTGWLEEWGVDAGAHGGMDHGDGMMSDDDMAALESASGAEASSLFLEQMIEHHEGAIHMAERELADGRNADVLELAQKIIDDQSAEIAEMRELLATL